MQFDMPGAVLAMDGTHVPVFALPLELHRLFFNVKEGSQAILCHIVVGPT